MKLSCKPVAAALLETSIAGLIERSQRLERITEAVMTVSRNTLPVSAGLLPNTPRCEVRDRIVIIAVSSPSHAAKLRQRTRDLEQLLQGLDPEITGIRIRLQPERPTYHEAATKSTEAPPTSAAALSQGDLEPVREFADQLVNTLRDSDLRAAAQRLQKTLRKRASHGERE